MKGRSLKAGEALELYASIFEDHPLGYFLLDEHQEIIKANEAFAKLLGYQPKDLVGKSLDFIVDPAKVEQHQQLAVKLHSGLIRDLDMEGDYLSASGDLVHCRSLIKAVFNEQGSLRYCIATVIDLRQAKETEADLRNTRNLWETAYAKASFGIAFIDPAKMRFISANRAFVDTVGYQLDELLAISPLEISPRMQPSGQESSHLAKQYIKSAMEGHSPHFEWHHIHKNGEDRFFVIRLDRVQVEDRVRILALAEDITDVRRQEYSIRQSEERFRNLYHNNPLMLFTSDTTGNVLAANNSACEQLGFSMEEILNRPIPDFFHPDDKQKLLAKLSTFLHESEEQTKWQLRKITKKGEIIYVDELIKKIEWSGQDALLIACENVTERVIADRIRRQSEERYRMIFDTNFLGIAITEPSGRFEMVNPMLCQMLGYQESELLALGFLEITEESDRERSAEEVLQMRSNKSALVMEKKYRRKDGSVLDARVMAKLLREDEPEGKALAMIWDISAEKKLQEQKIEISAKTQELTTYTLFLTQKNELLRQLTGELQELGDLVEPSVHQKLRRIITRIEQDVNTENTWIQFQKHFQSANPNFLPNLRNEYPNLTPSEQRHCALVVMAMSNAEVANLLHVTPKAVEVARYRLKKKFALHDRRAKLSLFLQKFL